MHCPYCNSPNDPSNRFCASCGKPLHGQASPPSSATNEPAYSPRAILGIQTARLLLSLLGLWLLKAILTGLPFVEELHIPEVDISTPSIISSLIYLVIVIVLVKYASLLSRLWPQAFPGYPQAASVWVAIVYLIVLAMAYNSSKPIFQAVTTDAQLMMIMADRAGRHSPIDQHSGERDCLSIPSGVAYDLSKKHTGYADGVCASGGGSRLTLGGSRE